MTNSTILTYYKILGIPENASIDTIRKAFRIKAKLLHPDRNNSSNSHEEFILLNEAYEYLIDLRSGKIKPETTNPFQSKQEQYEVQRAFARQRAAEYARMRYEEFIKTDEYKSVTSVTIIFNTFFLFLGLLFPLVITFLMTAFFGFAGFLITGSLSVIAYKYLIPELKKINVILFKDSVHYLFSARKPLLVIISIANAFLFLNIGLETLIPLFQLMLVYICAILVAYLYFYFTKRKGNNRLLIWGIAPLLINIFLLVNYLFSNTPVSETYLYKNYSEEARGRGGKRTGSMEQTTYIYLQDSKYEDYPGIRIFIDYDKMHGTNAIRYEFKNGLFGIRVMSDYSFFLQLK